MSLIWPTGSADQPYISDGYGPRSEVGNLGTLPFHHGSDVPMSRGRAVQAATDGEVIFSGWFIGETVVVRSIIDGFTVDFIYPHMESGSRILAGSRVRAGSTVGTCGTTGQSTGPHVCFRIIVNGNWRTYAGSVDPVIFMAEHNTGTASAGRPSEEDDMYNDIDRAEAKLALEATARIELGTFTLNKKVETGLAKLDLLLWAIADPKSGLRIMFAQMRQELAAVGGSQSLTQTQLEELDEKVNAWLVAAPSPEMLKTATLSVGEIEAYSLDRLTTDKPSIYLAQAQLNAAPAVTE